MLDDHVIAGVGGDTVDRSHLVALGRRRRRERPRARRCSAMGSAKRDGRTPTEHRQAESDTKPSSPPSR